MKLYKLTDQFMKTYGGFQWTLGEWVETDGKGQLCGPGWLHAYSDPVLALFMNPIHAAYDSPRVFEAEGEGRCNDDLGLKCGVTRLRVVKELVAQLPTSEQKVRFAIYCALSVYTEAGFRNWAKGWLTNKDRTEKTATANATADNAYSYAYAYAATAAAAAYADATDATGNAYAYNIGNAAGNAAATAAKAYAAKAYAYAEAYAAEAAYAKAYADTAKAYAAATNAATAATNAATAATNAAATGRIDLVKISHRAMDTNDHDL